MRRHLLPTLLACLIAFPTAADADAIEGVQPASLDQPRVFLNLRVDPKGPPMGQPKDAAAAKKAEGLDDPIFAGLDLAPPPPSTVSAFLDTGASGILISAPTAEGLKLTAEKGATFSDIGVGGSEAFGISAPLYVSVAPYSSSTDGGNPAAYAAAAGPVRLQLARGGGLLDALTGGTDVAGMPVMAGKVVVLDARPVNTFSDVLKTSIVAPGDPSIPPMNPQTDATVPLTYVAFARFTKTTPATAAPPTLAANPMIGPSPLDPADRAAPVTFGHNGKSATGTVLLDTGAAASMISTAVAAKLGITYAPDGVTLLGVPKDRQFSLPLGGVGGAKTVTGFYLDSLALPAKAGQPVVYAKAPVLVNDISVVDEKTGQKVTLDGVFGMNFLVASVNITGGILPDLGKMSEGAFDFIVIDHAAGELRLKRR